MTPTLHPDNEGFIKGQVIFEDEDHPEWAILKPVDLQAYGDQDALIGHLCRRFTIGQYLNAEDGLTGTCWWCKEKVPTSILGVWRLMNFDRIPRLLERVEKNDQHWHQLFYPDKGP